MLAFKTFEPEQNVFEKFDDGFTPVLKKDYDLAKEADWASINIASTKGDVKEGIADPYEDQSPRVKVPDAVYTQDAPYKMNVVEIGEPTLGKPFHEYTHAEEGDAVMGKDYVDTPFDVTLNSVPEKNPSRDWEFLDVDAMAGKVGFSLFLHCPPHFTILYGMRVCPATWLLHVACTTPFSSPRLEMSVPQFPLFPPVR